MDESQPILPVFIVKEPGGAITEIGYQFFVIATDVTATAPHDYMAPQAINFIEPESQELPFIVVIIDDPLLEGIETFQLELFVAEQPHFLLGSVTRVTVTIADDDEREEDRKKGREKGRKKGRREGVGFSILGEHKF